MTFGRIALLVAVVCILPSRSARATPTASDRARSLSASPDAPTFGLLWRGALRGTLGAEVPIAPRMPGALSLGLVPFVELHNDPGSSSPLPNESWRGRLAIESWWTSRGAFAIGLGIEHESDHSTSRAGVTPGFLELNDVALRTAWSVVLGRAALAFGVDARLFAISCTRIAAGCADFAGSTSFGATTSAVLDTAGLRGVASRWYPFVSVDASGIVGARDVERERRAVVHVGMWSSTDSTGIWALFVLAFAGNDVGIRRAESVAQLGVGASWSR